MTSLDDELGRDFDGLDIKETQAALAEEMAGEELSAASDEAPPPDSDAEPAVAATENADEEDSDEDAARESSPDPVWNAAQEAEHLRMVEALLFAASEPLTPDAIATRLPQGVDVPAMLETLTKHYENRGVNLAKAAGRWRFVTAADVAHVLETEKVEPRKISRAALETLAIIAYHQPCTRADIEDVRGVAVSKGSLDQLMEIGWVKLRGRRRDAPGRPVLYGTSPAFLEHFSLDTVEDLPGMADLKAAGLLDARLPPGFSIPTPREADEVEEAAGEDETAEFAQDFMADEGPGEAIEEA
ncbi:MAG: SMC-Scp complex subunit ScpB [Pseudomonadota bacterium]